MSNCVVTRVENPAGCLHRLWVKSTNSDGLPGWEPGQFVRLGVPDGDETPIREGRPYTIAGATEDSFELFLVAVGGGGTSEKLAALKEGDTLWMHPKVSGKFTLAKNPEGDSLILIGSGTGIAPFMAMISNQETVLNSYKQILIIHQVRSAEHLIFNQELSEFASNDERRLYLPYISQPSEPIHYADDHCAQSGYIHEAIARGDLNRALSSPLSDSTVVMISGNPNMIKSVTGALEGCGLTKHKKKVPGNIVSEEYW